MTEQPPRGFPPPWTVEETAPCFIVRDANKQGLAFVYFEDEPGRRAAANLMTKDEPAGSRQTSPAYPNCGALSSRTQMP